MSRPARRPARGGEEGRAVGGDEGMDHRLDPGEQVGIVDHRRAQHVPVDGAAPDRRRAPAASAAAPAPPGE
jgi:hypothetical protein